MDRQFVAVTFRRGDARTYTYHNDGPPVVPGDEVKVPDRSGDGWRRVYVDSVSFAPPAFVTKPILGRVQEGEEPPAKAANSNPPPPDLLSGLEPQA